MANDLVPMKKVSEQLYIQERLLEAFVDGRW